MTTPNVSEASLRAAHKIHDAAEIDADLERSYESVIRRIASIIEVETKVGELRNALQAIVDARNGLLDFDDYVKKYGFSQKYAPVHASLLLTPNAKES